MGWIGLGTPARFSNIEAIAYGLAGLNYCLTLDDVLKQCQIPLGVHEVDSWTDISVCAAIAQRKFVNFDDSVRLNATKQLTCVDR